MMVNAPAGAVVFVNEPVMVTSSTPANTGSLVNVFTPSNVYVALAATVSGVDDVGLACDDAVGCRGEFYHFLVGVGEFSQLCLCAELGLELFSLLMSKGRQMVFHVPASSVRLSFTVALSFP